MTTHLGPDRSKIVVWCVVVLLLLVAAGLARFAAAQSLLPVPGLTSHTVPPAFDPGDALLRWKNGNDVRPGASRTSGTATATPVLQIVPSDV